MCAVKMLCVTGKALKDIRPRVLTVSGLVSRSSLCVPTELATHSLFLSLSSPSEGIYSTAKEANNNNE